ncbi:hypothetical protein BDV93DRAFT_494396 [Ceratobasidium sp. AG-I]|nr:hypothetical protein BDV93DRAFT_494396 [Ceratobasidium sp. AG-I]
MRPSHSFSRSLLSALLAASSVSAFWPFPAKRFKGSSLISAGGLGLDNVQGRVVAFGDLDGDQFLDLLVLTEDQQTVTAYLWDHDSFTYTKSTSLTLPSQNRIINVVPADLNFDGRLDLLFMSSGSGKTVGLDLFLGDGAIKGVNFGLPISLPSSGPAQPLVLDTTGDMRLDLLGVDPNSSMRLWKNSGDASGSYTITDPPLSDRVCKLADPHSNAVIDFNGDCVADIFLTCQEPGLSHQTFQIWTRSPGAEAKYTLAREGAFPKGAGPVSFADMDRDGTVDLVFPVCASFSSSTGVGLDCSIHIAYNKQIPLCTGGMSGRDGKCRSPGELCLADDTFAFDFNSVDAYDIFPLSDILPKQSSLLLTDTSHNPPLPLPLHIGDANLDGFPDILAVAVGNPSTNRVPVLLFNVHKSLGASSSSSTKLNLQRSLEQNTNLQRSLGLDTRIPRNTTGEALTVSSTAAKSPRRTFRAVKDGAGPLHDITDARGVAFLDLDEDGTLDILVQRTGAQTNSRVAFIQNNFFQDAFFLKAIVLNGACPSGVCAGNGSGTYKPSGAMNPGASFKYTVLDTSGQRSAASAGQLPQTGYQALNMPYAFLGLGRTNNYIENLFAGSTSPRSAVTLEGVIPNSKLVLNPVAEGDAWRKELFLRPGEWIWWVLFTLVGATLCLLAVVVVLHMNEKREDEKERRKALHHINFDAL